MAESGDSFGGWYDVANLVPGENTLTIALTEEHGDLSGSTGIGFQLAQPPTDDTIKEPILLRGIDIDLAG